MIIAAGIALVALALAAVAGASIHAARAEMAEAEEGQRIARALGRYNYRTNEWRPF